MSFCLDLVSVLVVQAFDLDPQQYKVDSESLDLPDASRLENRVWEVEFVCVSSFQCLLAMPKADISRSRTLPGQTKEKPQKTVGASPASLAGSGNPHWSSCAPAPGSPCNSSSWHLQISAGHLKTVSMPNIRSSQCAYRRGTPWLLSPTQYYAPGPDCSPNAEQPHHCPSPPTNC